jgi:hypothetical protein
MRRSNPASEWIAAHPKQQKQGARNDAHITQKMEFL